MPRASPRSFQINWPPQFRRAQNRVGVTAEARGTWLLEFARRERPLGTRGRSLRPDPEPLRWDALAFAKGPAPIPASEPLLPSRQELTEAHARLWATILEELRDSGEPEIETKWRGRLWMVDGVVYGEPRTEGLPFRDAFMIQAFDVLSSLDLEGLRLRFCLRCRRPFVAAGRQRYDTPSCSQADRTARYRTRHRDKLRAYRRQYYRDRVALPVANRP